MARTSLLSLIAAVVLFMYGFASHAVLPWYDTVYQSLSDEAPVSAALQENAPRKGIYFMPYFDRDRRPGKVEAFMNVLPQGSERSIGSKVSLDFASRILSAFLVISLLGKMRSGTYWGTVGLFGATGATIGFISHSYYWIWFEFPAPYVLVTILDSSIAWLLVGLTVAKFVRSES